MSKSKRIYNLSAGPAILPVPVVEQMQAALCDFQGSGLGIAEMSHRSALFESVNDAAQAGIRSLLAIPEDYEVLFMQGGATAQFAAVPMNFATSSTTFEYIDTGVWSQKALEEARRYGNVVVASSGKENHYRTIPAEHHSSRGSFYLHFTSNNTIYGTQFKVEPQHQAEYLVCDASSDILSKPLDISKYGLIYASTQKNAGIAGLTLVILKKELLDKVTGNTPQILDYRNYAKSQSLFNTPPTLAIYCVHEICNWIAASGGLNGMQRLAEQRSDLVYQIIDSSEFYQGVSDPSCRSLMNVTFRLSNEALNEQFLSEATEAGFSGLAGHRSAGGFRASMYNALPVDAAQDLANFMKEFETKFG
ncbi:MAG: 3-phosphoserine/phosphohydroxythreonine transaminase [Bdellovibrionales bacterium]|nr:3-phosphoserine/phosphohydroxythreonine transaminase [Bdellovibrionales bacterium]